MLPTDTALADARESYAYWRSRRSTLAWHRRGARREARVMAARWRGRLVSAHLRRTGLGTMAVVLEPIVASVLGSTRRDHARWLWRIVGRRTPLASRKLWLALAVATAALAALSVLALHAAWALLL